MLKQEILQNLKTEQTVLTQRIKFLRESLDHTATQLEAINQLLATYKDDKLIDLIEEEFKPETQTPPTNPKTWGSKELRNFLLEWTPGQNTTLKELRDFMYPELSQSRIYVVLQKLVAEGHFKAHKIPGETRTLRFERS